MGIYEEILKLEMNIHKLKVEYDQYFGGVLRIPPFKLHEEVKKQIRLQSGQQISNTSLKFKQNSLVGRYTSYNTLWERWMRQLEDGTFRKGRHSADTAAVNSPERPLYDESPAEKLYKDYVAANTSLNKSSGNITVARIQDTIDKQTDTIKSKYKCTRVDYKVVIEEGKAKIKAIPKK